MTSPAAIWLISSGGSRRITVIRELYQRTTTKLSTTRG
jgi:hypothetical protein